MDVLLFNCPQYIPKTPGLAGRAEECLGLACIAAALRGRGIETEILDAAVEGWDGERAFHEVTSRHFKVLGVSLFYVGYLMADNLALLRRLRGALPPDVHMCVGGYVATFAHDNVFHLGGADSAVLGEGEATFTDLALALLEGKDFRAVPGIACPAPGGGIYRSEPRPLIADLDTLPFPARDCLAASLAQGSAPSISTSRGCYGGCSFCSISEFYRRSHGPACRYRSPANVVDELEHVAGRFKIDRPFSVVDDEFVGNSPERAWRIAEEILRRRLKVRFFVYARANAVKPELFRLLKEAGLIAVSLGIESFVPRTLKLLGKGYTPARAHASIETLRELGIATRIGYIMFDPDTTLDEVAESVRAIKDCGMYTVKITDGLLNSLGVFRGTPVHRRLEREGRLKSPTLLQYKYPWDFSDGRTAAFHESVIGHRDRLLQSYLGALQRRPGGGNAGADAARAPLGAGRAARYIKESILSFFSAALDVALAQPDAAAAAGPLRGLLETETGRAGEEIDRLVKGA